MTLARLTTTLCALSLASTAAAHADTRDFLNRCSPGAIRTCASLSVTTVLNGSGGTSVVIRVRNLQGGASWLGDNTGGSMLTRIGIVTPTISGFSGPLTVTTSGGATTTGTPASAWFLRRPGGIGAPIELAAGINRSTSRAGIVGCSSPNGGLSSSYFQTCGSGWVEFAFTTTNAWSASNSEVAWLASDIVNPAAGVVECGSNFAGNARDFCSAAVTPEPVTMMLLGTGLAGMSGLSFFRRRRDTAEVV